MYKVCIPLLLVSLLLSGCSFLDRFTRTSQPPELAIQYQELERLNSHLTFMRELQTAEYREQEQLFAKVEEESVTLGTPGASLRLALALITDSHPNTDIGRGYIALKEIAENPQGLSDPEIKLTRILLENVETIMIVEAQNAELSGVVSEAHQRINRSGRSSRESLEQASVQLQEANIEIESLRIQLRDALDKLDAIKNIEVSSE